jgi:hypothetical protein
MTTSSLLTTFTINADDDDTTALLSHTFFPFYNVTIDDTLDPDSYHASGMTPTKRYVPHIGNHLHSWLVTLSSTMTIVLLVRDHLFTWWHAMQFYSRLGQSPAALISYILFSTVSLIATMRLDLWQRKSWSTGVWVPQLCSQYAASLFSRALGSFRPALAVSAFWVWGRLVQSVGMA